MLNSIHCTHFPLDNFSGFQMVSCFNPWSLCRLWWLVKIRSHEALTRGRIKLIYMLCCKHTLGLLSALCESHVHAINVLLQLNLLLCCSLLYFTNLFCCQHTLEWPACSLLHVRQLNCVWGLFILESGVSGGHKCSNVFLCAYERLFVSVCARVFVFARKSDWLRSWVCVKGGVCAKELPKPHTQSIFNQLTRLHYE